MIFNKDKTKFYCSECKKWISIYPCEYLLINDSVQCFQLHHCGYYHDLFPCRHYEEYHGERYCRCVWELSDCKGKEENCIYFLSRIAYEEDEDEQTYGFSS